LAERVDAAIPVVVEVENQALSGLTFRVSINRNNEYAVHVERLRLRSDREASVQVMPVAAIVRSVAGGRD
jgi:hypothetical protein